MNVLAVYNKIYLLWKFFNNNNIIIHVVRVTGSSSTVSIKKKKTAPYLLVAHDMETVSLIRIVW